MEAVWLTVGQIVLDYGFPGVAILYLYRENGQLKEKLDGLGAKLDTLQEKRLEENGRMSAAVASFAHQSEKLTEIVRHAVSHTNRGQ